ncbi:MAG: hypothetical protein M1828_001354 [Chrysothrix sp. TS-e1954]|nr:MAG: hypothetical protein M1828_001354 [Chrysothrix sp. TS-e1954]
MANCYQTFVRKLSLKELWSSQPPKEAKNRSMEVYLKEAGKDSFMYDSYHRDDEFRERYEAQYHKAPLVNRVTQWRWDVGSKISKAARDHAVFKMEVYKEWVLQSVLQVQQETTLVVLPVMDVEPNYRDTLPGPPFSQDVWDSLWLSPVLGAPEITVPVGEVPYLSRISNKREMLPVAISWLSRPGSDTMLARTVTRCFEESKRSLTVAAGSSIYAPR